MRASIVVIAPDKFKDAVGADVAARAIRAGVVGAHPDAEVVMVPLSDGGDGFLEAVGASVPAEKRRTPARNARGEWRDAPWLRQHYRRESSVLPECCAGGSRVEDAQADERGVPACCAGDSRVAAARAWIESAAVIGLAEIPVVERDVMQADSRGLGVLVRAALDAGCDEIIIGLGGTATCDGGAGMLAELGVRLLDAGGRELEPTPESLAALASLDASRLDPRLAGVRLIGATDVRSPLLGPDGAAAVFAPQKGATSAQVDQLDALLARLAHLFGGTARPDGTPPSDAAAAPGAGAAGGLGWALMALGGELRAGFDLVADLVGLQRTLDRADMVITGEGSFDAQSLQGKVVAGVARLCAERHLPCHLLAGRVQMAEREWREAGFASVTAISEGLSIEDALPRTAELLEQAAAALAT